MKRVAVILSGCGVYDGAEIHEATATLLALDRKGAEAIICAPSGPQMHVVNHLSGEPAAGETRDILVEAARIARGNIRDIKAVEVDQVDAVILPGGFGAAKNLSSFVVDGDSCQVQPDVAAFLQAAHAKGKPIGAICISPAVVARLFGTEKPVQLTIGTDPDTAKAINSMGAKHVNALVQEIVVDEQHRIVSTPAYMLAEHISEVFDGIEKLVDQILAMC
jgi:enhancing lycopene biosynthesis protein 2